MQIELPFLRQMEDLEHPDGLALEQAGIADVQPVALDQEAVDLAPAEAEAGQ